MSAGTVLIMAGGTGGHVFPGLALAAELRARDVPVVWLGTPAGMEARAVPGAGIELRYLRVRGLRGGGWRRWLMAPMVLLLALFKAMATLRAVRPAVVVSMGGFAAGPGGLAAWLLRYPLLVHEQNAVPGMTNRILARFAAVVLCAFPDTFPARRAARVIGNPVRADIRALADPETRLADRQGQPARLLVLGGSQGALGLNRLVPPALAQITQTHPLQVRHQSGQAAEDTVREAYANFAGDVTVESFVDDMAAAYAWADLVIARAGALTIAELQAAGLGAVLIPYPHAVDDHQARNAEHMVDAGAAVMLRQDGLDPARLARTLMPLLADAGRRLDMARAARAQARPQAVDALATACLTAGGIS